MGSNAEQILGLCEWVFSVGPAVKKKKQVTFVAVCYKVWESNILFGGHVCPTVYELIDLSAPKPLDMSLIRHRGLH